MIDILLRIEPKHNKIHIHDYLAVTSETENSCTNVAGKATLPDKSRRSHAAVHELDQKVRCIQMQMLIFQIMD
jgi:hypothetical protein